MPAGRILSLVRGRAAVTWLGPIVVACIGLAIASRRPVPLADAAACPGLYDLISVIAGRTSGDTPLAHLLSAMNSGALFLALVALGRLLQTITASFWIAAAIAAAAASTPVFAPVLAPVPAGAIAACAAAWLAAIGTIDSQPAPVWRVAIAVLAIALASAIVPAFAVPLGAAAGWIAWRGFANRAPASRMVWTVVAGALVPGVALLTLAGLPAVPSLPAAPSTTSCIWPHDLQTSAVAVQRFGAVLGAIPAAMALAAVGVIAPRRLWRGSRVLLAIAIVAALWAGATPTPVARAFAPAVLAVWAMSGAGLREARDALGQTVGGRAGASAIAIAIVTLQLLRLSAATVTADLAPAGHQTMSRNTFSTLVRPMPDDSALVAEDALTDLLMRTLPARARARRSIVAADPEAIRALLPATRVFALPRAQARLQHLGADLADAGGRLRGLAEIRAIAPCSAPLTVEWRAAPELRMSARFALVADAARSYEHVHVLLSGDAPYAPRALDWPAPVSRFFWQTFDLANPSDRQRLDAELAEVGGAGRVGVLPGRHVTHIEMWRVPGAPLALPVELGGHASAVSASRAGMGSGGQLRLCPSLPYSVNAIEGR